MVIPTDIDWLARSKIIRKQTSKSSIQCCREDGSFFWWSIRSLPSVDGQFFTIWSSFNFRKRSLSVNCLTLIVSVSGRCQTTKLQVGIGFRFAIVENYLSHLSNFSAKYTFLWSTVLSRAYVRPFKIFKLSLSLSKDCQILSSSINYYFKNVKYLMNGALSAGTTQKSMTDVVNSKEEFIFYLSERLCQGP